ncbi:MAG: ABC transporter ATP-binding protein [Myxococcota bacterium]
MSVAVENLTKRFAAAGAEGQPAVADVSFHAPHGAITTLLGPSGSGKSTILRLIAGLEQPDAGAIRIDGADCAALPPQKRGVGLVFQGYALFGHMTVRDNVAFGLAVRGTPRAVIDARVDALLDLVQLRDLAARRPSQLSGGQRQRIAFARALAPRPRLLLLDEPFGALDARVRVELRDWLRRLHAETGVTTLLVTHDQTEALELSEHVVVLMGGRVAQAGPPHQVYDQPSTPEVASFVGGANLLDGRAFVRPQDVKLTRPADAAPPGAAAREDAEVSLGRIRSLRRIGAVVRLVVELPDGETVAVESPRGEIDALGLAEGDRVMVDLRAAKVFVEDYSI